MPTHYVLKYGVHYHDFYFPSYLQVRGGLQTQETSKQLIADTLYRLTNTLTHMQKHTKKHLQAKVCEMSEMKKFVIYS